MKTVLKSALFLSALIASSKASAFNTTICSGTVNGKEIAHAVHVDPSQKNTVLHSANGLVVTIDLDPESEANLLRLKAVATDADGAKYTVRAQQLQTFMGSIATIDAKLDLLEFHRTLRLNITCENQYGD
jgi:hypothetical protein